ncbi:MAG: hypothetical protein KKC80_06050 [Candidatus Margulisbacteria bacterium]|nr:hypothetical protein [Candidatus Margulisiibacteriota bacterium]MBU1616892.1 hypothetical protein [Candidatus Margulisiibacteriota bacterium]
MPLISRLSSILPLRWGTVVSADKPGGAKALFFRGIKGEHRPLIPTEGNDRLFFLAPRQEVMRLLEGYKAIDEGSTNGANSLPPSLRREVFLGIAADFAALLNSGLAFLIERSPAGTREKTIRRETSGTYFFSTNENLTFIDDHIPPVSPLEMIFPAVGPRPDYFPPKK